LNLGGHPIDRRNITAEKIFKKTNFQYMTVRLNNILPNIIVALKLVEQQKIDIAEESTTSAIRSKD
jgi:hypothetical protein